MAPSLDIPRHSFSATNDYHPPEPGSPVYPAGGWPEYIHGLASGQLDKRPV